MGNGKNWFLPLEVVGSYWEWQEPVLATRCVSRQGLTKKLWGVARTGSCHLQSGKNRFLPLENGKNWFLPLENGKNWFLPHRLEQSGKNCGKNQVLATFFGKKWQEPRQESCLNYIGISGSNFDVVIKK